MAKINPTQRTNAEINVIDIDAIKSLLDRDHSINFLGMS
jgi:hypothetical protein